MFTKEEFNLLVGLILEKRSDLRFDLELDEEERIEELRKIENILHKVIDLGF